LQNKIYEILEPILSGVCIVMDVHTGAIKSFVSFPGFDSNMFVNQISRHQWRELSQNIYHPLINKAISGLYAPGSTFKMITSLAALKAGIVNQNQTYYCPGHFDYHGIRFHCWNWKQGGHGTVNMTQALARSCDVYFYNLALQLKADDIADMATKFGLGTPTGIEIPNEKKGLVPTTKWKYETKKQRWTPGETINISIGQGYLLTTPLQLAKMTAMLANGGKIIEPHLVSKDTTKSEQIDIDPKHLEIIMKGMFDAVNDPCGTGHKAKLKYPDWQLCGKTGSTQVAKITAQQRAEGTHNDRPWHLKEHALFTGVAPFSDPKYSVVVLIEHGGGGGKVAAPIAKQVMEAVKEIIG
jgi:penicillin-binding protein 2